MFIVQKPWHPFLLNLELSIKLWHVPNMSNSRITVNPKQCGGRPCIRGMRIRVVDVLDLLSNGLSIPQILEELPDLEEEDVFAAIRYARERIDHPVVAA